MNQDNIITQTLGPHHIRLNASINPGVIAAVLDEAVLDGAVLNVLEVLYLYSV